MPTLKEICDAAGGTVQGDPEFVVTGVGSLDHAGPTDLAPLDDELYVRNVAESKAGALIVAPRFAEHIERNAIVHDFPLIAMNAVIDMVGLGGRKSEPGIHETAIVEDGAQIPASCSIGPWVQIQAGAVLGDCVTVESNAVIEGGVTVGDHCRIEIGAILHEGTEIGHHTTIGAHSVIGRQGFGFTAGPQGPVRLRHVGKAIIGNHCHVGAQCTIDRARFDVTLIDDMTALDNMVHVGHNSRVGKRCFLAAQCGLAGHAIVEDDCALGGQAGVSNKVVVGRGTQVGAQSGVMQSFKPGSKILGSPARRLAETMRMESTLRRLALTKDQRKRRREP